MERLLLKPKEERRLLRGHLWAYRNEFAEIPEVADGEVVDVYSSQRLVGRGFYQSQGGIAVRILTRHQRPITQEFFTERIAEAGAFRTGLFPNESVYRWLFGESDGLPGFVADRYGSVISAQTNCRFYVEHADLLAEAFLAHEGVTGVRIDMPGGIRRYGEVPESVTCTIDGVQVSVLVEGGQKTGLFLDQRLNWWSIRQFAPGGRILDGHCYVGLWSVNAALGGAQEVLGVDTSGQAVAAAEEVARANGMTDLCQFERADIADVLERGASYDVIVLDPPAFAKSHAQEAKALKHYQALNASAMRALAPGGILITSTCSHFVSRESFLETLKRAAATAQRPAWLLDLRGASPDHPVLLSMPETEYLTCATLRIP